MNVLDDKFNALLQAKRQQVRAILDEKETKKLERAREKSLAALDAMDSDSETEKDTKTGANAGTGARLDFATNKIVNDMKQHDIMRKKKSKRATEP